MRTAALSLVRSPLNCRRHHTEVHVRDVRIAHHASFVRAADLRSASKAKEVLAVEVVGLQSMQDYQRKRSFLVSGGAQGEEAALYIERQRKHATHAPHARAH